MEENDALKIKKPAEDHRVARPTQTRFSSSATYYNEPSIHLISVMINAKAIFYICVNDDPSLEFGFLQDDVLNL